SLMRAVDEPAFPGRFDASAAAGEVSYRQALAAYKRLLFAPVATYAEGDVAEADGRAADGTGEDDLWGAAPVIGLGPAPRGPGRSARVARGGGPDVPPAAPDVVLDEPGGAGRRAAEALAPGLAAALGPAPEGDRAWQAVGADPRPTPAHDGGPAR